MNSALVGGPKDITPPKLALSIPAINSVNFKGRRIEITFDEFLKQTDIAKELVISPPLKKKPSIIQRNKSITIILDEKDTLKANTTYTFYFGNSVQDLNEGNVLKHFEFVFSTGNTVDSLSLRGRVVKSFDHTPDKDGLYVMLYDRFEDSIPRKTLPNYVTKTDENGYFNLTHLREGSYMIFALKDANQNYLFDLPNESIAFSDTAIRLDSSYYVPPDSLVLKDTAKFDSLRKVLPYLKPQIELFSFEEDNKKQYLSKYDRPQIYKFSLKFNRVPYDSVEIIPLNFSARQWFIQDSKIIIDSAIYWITDTALIHKDTLKTIITYSRPDSIGQMKIINDTILLTAKKRIVSKQVKKDSSKKRVNDFKISSPADKKEGIDLNKTVFLTATMPLQTIDTTKIHFFKKEDTKEATKIALKYTLKKDSDFIRKYWLYFNMEPKTEYLLIADSGAFTSIYNNISDSTGIKFRTQKDDYYGTLTFNMQNVKQHTILQILGKDENVIKEKYTDSDGKVLFDFLDPGKYKVKAIYDRNNNRKWDTGNFGKRIQPEHVEYFEKIITVRSNWDSVETWYLK